MEHFLVNSGADAIKLDSIKLSINENATQFQDQDDNQNDAFLSVKVKFDAKFISIQSENKSKEYLANIMNQIDIQNEFISNKSKEKNIKNNQINMKSLNVNDNCKYKITLWDFDGINNEFAVLDMKIKISF